MAKGHFHEWSVDRKLEILGQDTAGPAPGFEIGGRTVPDA